MVAARVILDAIYCAAKPAPTICKDHVSFFLFLLGKIKIKVQFYTLETPKWMIIFSAFFCVFCIFLYRYFVFTYILIKLEF